MILSTFCFDRDLVVFLSSFGLLLQLLSFLSCFGLNHIVWSTFRNEYCEAAMSRYVVVDVNEIDRLSYIPPGHRAALTWKRLSVIEGCIDQLTLS